MITKCLVVLALASQISAFKYNQEPLGCAKPEQSVSNNFKYSYQATPISEKFQKIVKASSNQNQNLAYVRPAINTSPITRTFVARGKYPVTLQNSGPAPDRKISVITSHLRTPVQEKPTVRLQAKIPAPKTIAHTCTCFKTIVKPRVQQHLISVPTIQRYIETLHRPVVENIHYEAYPVRCLESTNEDVTEERSKTETVQVRPVEVSSISRIQNEKNSGIQTFEFPSGQSFELPKAQTEKSRGSQVIEIPRIQFAEGQKSHTDEIPRVQFIQNKKPQTVEIELPRVRFVEPEKSETFEIPHQTQFFEGNKKFVEILNAQFLDNNKPEKVQLPRLEFVQAQKLQTVEIPRIQVEESPKVQTVEIPHHQGGAITLEGTPFTYQSKH